MYYSLERFSHRARAPQINFPREMAGGGWGYSPTPSTTQKNFFKITKFQKLQKNFLQKNFLKFPRA